MSQQEVTSDDLITVGTKKGAKPLATWKWQEKDLTLPAKKIKSGDLQDSLVLTAWVVDQLRVMKHNNVRTLIEEHTNILRLLELKEVRERGEIVPAKLSLVRPQQAQAIAAQLVLAQVNVRPCQACASSKSKGPFATCVSFGPEHFGGACACCQYSSLATSCVFHDTQKGTKYAQQKGDAVEVDLTADEDIRLTPKNVQKLPTRTLEHFQLILANEIKSRAMDLEGPDPDETPSKKRKSK